MDQTPNVPQDDAIERAGRALVRLVEIMRTLRSRDGCPWDREQTFETLRPFVLEEAYEVLDAIDRGRPEALRDEIGDLMFEGVFLAQLGAEQGRFTIAESLEGVVAKLIRRHPHVFGDSTGPTTGGHPSIQSSHAVLEQWEELKAKERTEAGERNGVLEGIPRTLPALLRAYEIGCRVAAVGFDWPGANEVVVKIEEELRELRGALAHEGRGRAEEELGDLLFAIANLSRKLGIEPEAALRRANDKFAGRFGRMERRLESRGRSVHDVGLEALEAEWAEIKKEE